MTFCKGEKLTSFQAAMTINSLPKREGGVFDRWLNIPNRPPFVPDLSGGKVTEPAEALAICEVGNTTDGIHILKKEKERSSRNSLPFKQQERETHFLSSSKDDKLTSFQAARTRNSLPFKQQGRETHFLSSSKDEKLTSFYYHLPQVCSYIILCNYILVGPGFFRVLCHRKEYSLVVPVPDMVYLIY
jgi:hypothetical protein